MTVALSANVQPDTKQLVRYVKKSVVKNPEVGLDFTPEKWCLP